MLHKAPSEHLDALKQRIDDETITLRELTDALPQAGPGVLLLLCGLAGLVPGVTVVLGVPLCLIGAGFVIGHETPWLPNWLARRTINGQGLARAIDRLNPRLRWLERRTTVRAHWALGTPALRLVGLAMVLCGVLIILPIPFGNTAPAVAVIVTAAGLLVRDGIAVLVGLGVAMLALALDGALVFGSYAAGAALLGFST